jgi:hypothetical protein
MPMMTQRLCKACGKTHGNKAIHLRLDGNGDVIVSEEIFAALQAVFLGGLEVANGVSAPPTTFLGAVTKDKERIIDAPLNSDNAASPLITPARTKYENRDRMLRALRELTEALTESLEGRVDG